VPYNGTVTHIVVAVPYNGTRHYLVANKVQSYCKLWAIQKNLCVFAIKKRPIRSHCGWACKQI